MKFLNRLTSIFKKKEIYEMPFIRSVIVYNENVLENGSEDDLNKMIIVYHGNEKFKEMSYSKARIKILQEVEHIPVFDFTKEEEKYKEGEEIIPSEIYYESFQ